MLKKILIDIAHPAHVHLFKHFAKIMIQRGHSILFVAREKEVAVDLLKEYGFDYRSFGPNYGMLGGKLFGMAKFDYLLYREARKFNPDIFLSMASIYAAHVAFSLRKPHVAFEDSEPVPEHQILYVPITQTILTPHGLLKDFGKKQIRYHGFNELAYLHPTYFKPDRSALSLLGVTEGEKFAVLRFVAFKASHDFGINGFSDQDKVRIVRELEKTGKVFITSEGNFPDELEGNRAKIPPSKLQDILFFASLYLGDSQTMATEAALLGTPAVRCNSFAKSTKEMSNFIELEKNYQLLLNFNIRDKQKAIKNAVALFQHNDMKKTWEERRDKLLSRKIDVTAFMVWFMERYPESTRTMKADPEYQWRFK